MGIAADNSLDWNAALAALAWQVDLGVSEVVQDSPQDSFALPEAAPWARRMGEPAAAPIATARAPVQSAPPSGRADAVAAARSIAFGCETLEALHAAMKAFDLCELKRGAKNTVFSGGNPAARVMILTEAPGRPEDIEGRPFVGPAGQLLDAMFAAIGLSRDSADAATALYIAPVVPWRPPGDRPPEADEIAMLLPFVERHVALVRPRIIVTLGNTALSALTGKQGAVSARGTWAEAFGTPLMPMVHPNQLLSDRAAKRGAWADLLDIKARLT